MVQCLTSVMTDRAYKVTIATNSGGNLASYPGMDVVELRFAAGLIGLLRSSLRLSQEHREI